MALRLIEIVLQKQHLAKIRNFLESHEIIEHRELKLCSDKMLVRILLEAEQSVPVLNFFNQNFTDNNNHLVILPVEAVVPRLEKIESATIKKKRNDRISSEELYEDIQHAADYSKTYVAMLILASIVAAVGLHQNSVISIIGAMVIAPMLGPILAVALGLVLGESKLLLRSIITAIIGISLVLILGYIFGALAPINPSLPEIAARIKYQTGDLIVALASGCAGALAFTTGVAETIIGVMVAVSLLPPLLTCALLIGSGYSFYAVGALDLFILNLASVNLASITVFLVKGIFPINMKNQSAYHKFIYSLILLGWLAVLVLILAFFELELTEYH